MTQEIENVKRKRREPSTTRAGSQYHTRRNAATHSDACHWDLDIGKTTGDTPSKCILNPSAAFVQSPEGGVKPHRHHR